MNDFWISQHLYIEETGWHVEETDTLVSIQLHTLEVYTYDLVSLLQKLSANCTVGNK